MAEDDLNLDGEGPADSDEEEKKMEDKDSNAAHLRPAGINSVRVSTRTNTALKLKGLPLVLNEYEHRSRVLKRKEAAKALLEFPNLRGSEQEDRFRWHQKSHPVMVNSRIPGLLPKWRAPLQDEMACRRRQGELTLTVINPTKGTWRLPAKFVITTHKTAKFVKTVGSRDSDAMMVLGPTTPTKIPVLNTMGEEVHVNKINITEVERDVVKRAKSTYASFVKSEDILLKIYPKGELKEEFPEQDPNRVPDTVREFPAEINRQETHAEEFLAFPNIKVNAETITFSEYSKLGELPFTNKTDPVTMAMAVLLASLGCSMQLSFCKRRTLQTVLDQFDQKPIVSLKKQLQNNFSKNRVMEIYRLWPNRLAIRAHMYCSEASIALRRINMTKASRDQKVRQKMAVIDCLHANIHAVTALLTDPV